MLRIGVDSGTLDADPNFDEDTTMSADDLDAELDLGSCCCVFIHASSRVAMTGIPSHVNTSGLNASRISPAGHWRLFEAVSHD